MIRGCSSSLRVALRAVAALLLLALPVFAAAEPIFGPTVYTKTASGAPDFYTDPVAAAVAGPYFLWVQNGDDDGGGVTTGSITVNGAMVAGDALFRGPRELFVKAVHLRTGANSLSVTLNGETGSFITVLILGPRERPFLTVGRLILPYAAASPNLQLELKNGSHGGARAVRVHFYDSQGALVGTSGRLVLDRKASLSAAVFDLLTSGAFTEGSIEVFYAGPGRGRVFGQVATTNTPTGIASIVPFQHAGSRVRDPYRLLND